MRVYTNKGVIILLEFRDQINYIFYSRDFWAKLLFNIQYTTNKE
jgi:hypothetical protein